MEFLDEALYLARCCQLIEEKCKNGNSKYWKNSDYKNLSDQISQASRITISPDTLKRLYGKLKTYRSYNPQIETKNALAIFLGYTCWKDFKKCNHLPIPDALSTEVSIAEPLLATPREISFSDANGGVIYTRTIRKLQSRWLIVAVLGLIIIASLYLFLGSSLRRVPSTENEVSSMADRLPVVFTGKSLKGTVPHTAVFQYDVSQLDADSIFIDYGYHNFGYNEQESLPKYQQP